MENIGIETEQIEYKKTTFDTSFKVIDWFDVLKNTSNSDIKNE